MSRKSSFIMIRQTFDEFLKSDPHPHGLLTSTMDCECDSVDEANRLKELLNSFNVPYKEKTLVTVLGAHLNPKLIQALKKFAKENQ
jgi:hypothetical protein